MKGEGSKKENMKNLEHRGKKMIWGDEMYLIPRGMHFLLKSGDQRLRDSVWIRFHLMDSTNWTKLHRKKFDEFRIEFFSGNFANLANIKLWWKILNNKQSYFSNVFLYTIYYFRCRCYRGKKKFSSWNIARHQLITSTECTDHYFFRNAY